jgi:hypothetical protein
MRAVVASRCCLKDAKIDDDTGGAAHNVENVVHCASKIFAEGGEAFEYYLNESREFRTHKEEKIKEATEANTALPVFDDLRLPPTKGSRALIHGSLCYKIGLNAPAYNEYLLKHSTQTKVMGTAAKDANFLVRTMLHGMRDRFVICHMLHCGMYTACVADILVFVFNDLAVRPQAHSLWAIVMEVVIDLTVDAGHGNKFRTINPDAEHILKRRLLAKHPTWAEEFEAWEAKTGRAPIVERFMKMCRDPTRACMIAEFAGPAGERAKAKIMLHRGLDCSDIPILKNAPMNTDAAESAIGHFDYNLCRSAAGLAIFVHPFFLIRHPFSYSRLFVSSTRSLCNFDTVFGVVGAQAMQIFSSAASQLDRINKKKKAADKVKVCDKWSMTSYYSIPKALPPHLPPPTPPPPPPPFTAPSYPLFFVKVLC